MALFTARVEYALHTLLNIVRAGSGQVPSARDLADFQKLPVAFVQKLLTQLEKAGIVTGAEGRSGGWRLAKGAQLISVLEVAEAVQGRSPLFECREIRSRCALWPDSSPPRQATHGICAIQAVMLSAEAAMRRTLAQSSLAQIAGSVVAKSSSRNVASVESWFSDRTSRRKRASPRPNCNSAARG